MWRVIKLLVVPVPLAVAFFLFTEHQKHVARQQALGEMELSMLDFAKHQYASIISQSAQAAPRPLDIHAVMPAVPDGWTSLSYIAEHGGKITRANLDPSAPVTTTEAALQADFLAAAEGHHNMMAISYMRDNKVFALRMRPLPNPNENDLLLGGSQTTTNPVVTQIGDVPVHLLPQMSQDLETGSSSFVAYQRFHAQIDGKLDILAYGNGSLDDLRAILAGIDPQRLMNFAAIAAKPKPELTREAEIDDRVALATDPESPVVTHADATSWVSTLREIALGSNQGASAERIVLTCSQTSSGFKRCAQEK